MPRHLSVSVTLRLPYHLITDPQPVVPVWRQPRRSSIGDLLPEPTPFVSGTAAPEAVNTFCSGRFVIHDRSGESMAYVLSREPCLRRFSLR